jgi:hypothetical protein
MLRPAERREVAFECLDLGAKDVLAVGKYAPDRIIDGAAKAAALCGEVDEGN